MWVDEDTVGYWSLDESFSSETVTEDGHWKMNDTTGLPTVTDSSSNGNDGTAVGGLTSVTGKIGTALQFDGSSDYVSVATTPGQTGSYSCWFQRVSGTFDEIIMGSQNSSGDLSRAYLGLRDGKIVAGIGAHSWTVIFGTTTIVDGTWYHAVVTWDSSSVSLYLNGALEYFGDLDGQVSTLAIYIGGSNYGGSHSQPFSGIIDDVRTYQFSLSSSDVIWLYNNGDGRETSLTSSKIYSPVIKDLSHNNLHGQRYGSEPIDVADMHFSKSTKMVRSNRPYIKIPSDSRFRVPTLTIEYWIKLSDIADGTLTHQVVTAWDSSAGSGYNGPYINADGKFGFGSSFTSTGWKSNSVDLVALGIGIDEWVYLALTFDGYNVRYYVNGELELTDPLSSTPDTLKWTSHAAPIYIGKSYDGVSSPENKHVNGELAEIRISNRARTLWEIKRVWKGIKENDSVLGFVVDASDVKVCMNFDADVAGTDGVKDDANLHHGTVGGGTPAGTGLVGHWKMNDDAANTTVVDSVSAHNGVLSGGNTDTKSTYGRIDKSLALDGSGDIVTISDTSTLDFGTGDFAVACWIRIDSSSLSSSTGYGVISKTSTYQNTPGWVIEASTSGISSPYPFILIRGTTTGGTWFSSGVNSAAVMPTDKWNHVIFTRIGGTAFLYLNATLVEVNSHADVSLTVDNSQPIIVGDHSWGPNLPGRVEDLRLYDRGLGSEDALALYNDRKGLHTDPVDVAPRTLSPIKNGGYSFGNDTGRRITISNHADFNSANRDLTVECWCSVSSLTSGERRFVEKNDSGSPNAIPIPNIMLNSSDQPFAIIRDSAGVSAIATSPNPIKANCLTHLAGVWDSSSKRLILYVDGTPAAYADAPTLNLTGCSNTADLLLGGGSVSASNLVGGSISAFRLTHRARTGKEIFDHVRATNIEVDN